MIHLETDGDWQIYEWAPEHDRVRVTVFNMVEKNAWSFWFLFSDMTLTHSSDALKRFPCRHEWATAVLRRKYA